MFELLTMTKDISVIIVAAGASKRLKTKVHKPYLIVHGKPVLAHSIELFSKIADVKEIVIAIHKDDSRRISRVVLYTRHGHTDIKIVVGGATRAESVRNALNSTAGATKIILVHDAARPFVKKEHVLDLIKQVRKSGAAILATPIKDTIKRTEKRKNKIVIKETVTPKHELWAAQTPQGFKKDILLKAYSKLGKAALLVTDDASLMEQIKVPVSIVQGSEDNIKITTKEDLG